MTELYHVHASLNLFTKNKIPLWQVYTIQIIQIKSWMKHLPGFKTLLWNLKIHWKMTVHLIYLHHWNPLNTSALKTNILQSYQCIYFSYLAYRAITNHNYLSVGVCLSKASLHCVRSWRCDNCTTSGDFSQVFVTSILLFLSHTAIFLTFQQLAKITLI